jgi:hypothetical protein
MAMATLSRRLRKLEGRFDLGSESVVHVMQFVETDGTIVDTLTLIHGGQAKARPLASLKAPMAQKSQMIPDDPR